MRLTAMNRAVTVLVNLAILPFIVRHVGKDVYGVYTIVLTVTGYLGLLDFKIMSALTKYVAEYTGKGDQDRVDRIISASFSFYVLVGIAISLMMLACGHWFTDFFQVGAENREIVRRLFLVAAATAVLMWPSSTFRGVAQGLQLWGADSLVNIIAQLANALGAVMLLKSGRGIVELLLLSQSLTILGNLALFLVSRGRARFRLRFPCLDMDTYRLIFSFSMYIFISALINIFLFQVHNLIIGHFLSLSAVTVYAIAFNVQSIFRTINGSLGGPPWTIASQMEGQGDFAGQRRLLFTGTKLMSAMFVPVVVIMLFFVKPFILTWMGPGFEESVLPARIIIFFWLFNGTSELAGSMLSAKGIVREPMFISAAVAAANMVIGVSLIRPLGVTAMAVGLSASMVLVGFPLVMRLSLRSLAVPFSEFFNRSVRPNLPLYALAAGFCGLAFRFAYPANLIATLAEMAAAYGLALSAYYFLMLSPEERAEVHKLLGLERRA